MNKSLRSKKIKKSSSPIENPQQTHQSQLPSSLPLLPIAKINQEQNQSTVSHKKIGSFSELNQIAPQILFRSSESLELTQLLQKQPLFQCRPEIYRLSQNLFSHPNINYQMRTVLNNWLLMVASQNFFTRQTFAKASYYVDRYIEKSKNISKEYLQLLGFSALRLAARVQESKISRNVDKLFNKQDVVKCEQQICQILNYRLNPDTYIFWINLLMNLWDNYLDESKQYQNLKYLEMNAQCYKRCRKILDLCDLVNLDLKSLRFKTKQVILNLFFIVTRKYIQESYIFQQNAQQDGNKLSKLEGFKLFFIEFICKNEFECQDLKNELMQYLEQFLKLEISFSQPNIQLSSYNQYINIQTFNSKMLGFLRNIYQKRKA